ncbi:MAG TPA: formyltransferase family protein [Polyangiaceae bacterium]|nr:formyltransferase family protein [Polyangiaceae bacterium]
MPPRLRIVFLGLPLAALLLQRDGHEVLIAGLRKGLTLGARRLARQMPPQGVVIDPHRDWPAFAAALQELAPDLLVSWFFTRRIPMRVCRACRLGGIGVHPSLLPRHRGPDPFFAAIDSGDDVTGVTVHRIEAQYDTGAILGQERLAVDPGWNAWRLARALDRPSLRALRAMVARAASGDPLQGTPQQEALATEAPSPDDEARVLRWSWSAERIVRRIRALAPNPGAVAWVEDRELVVLEAQVADEVPLALEAGEAAVVQGRAVVRAADAGVALLRAEIDGTLVGPEELALMVAQASLPLVT